jgi:hypothetical protein
MLDRGAHTGLLHAAHVGHRHPRREQRILAEALKVPTRVRRALEVHGRGQQDVNALAARLRRQQASELLCQLLIPRRRQRRRRGHVGRRITFVPALPAHTGRAV